jgi:hypothetical protein
MAKVTKLPPTKDRACCASAVVSPGRNSRMLIVNLKTVQLRQRLDLVIDAANVSYLDPPFKPPFGHHLSIRNSILQLRHSATPESKWQPTLLNHVVGLEL